MIRGQIRCIALLGAAVAAMAACAPVPPPPPDDRFLVQTEETVHIVRFAPGEVELSAAERAALAGFAAGLAANAGVAEVRAAPPLGAARQRAVRSALPGTPTTLATVDALGDRVVVAVASRAILPAACLAPPLPGSGRLPPGCANARNLARAVERPADLLSGRRAGPAPAAPAALALERYLAGGTPALRPAEETGAGLIAPP